MPYSTLRIILASLLAAAPLAGCAFEPARSPSGAAGSPPEPAGGPETPLTISMMLESFGGIPDMNNAYFRALQEKTGVTLDIEWIPTADYADSFKQALASDQIPEVVVFDSPNHPLLIQPLRSDVFWDLTPFLGDFSEYPNLRDRVPSELFRYVTFRDRIMAIPRARSYIDHGIKIRKDWLDRLNIPMPTTLQEYAEALKRMVYEDPDGNGIADTIGLLDSPFANKPLMNAFGLNRLTYDESGYVIRDILTPQSVELVRWFHQLYKEGVLARPFAAIKRTYAEELLFSGRLASHTYSVYYDYAWEQRIRKEQPEAQLATIPVMEGPYGNTAYLQKGFTLAFYISRKVPEAKVKAILRYMNATASPAMTDFAYVGLEGVHHTIENGEPRLTPLGTEQMTVTALQPLATGFYRWSKVHSAAAPKPYNDYKKQIVGGFEEVGRQNPFDWLVSETWSDVWPRFQSEFDRQVLAAVTGKISIEEYEEYIRSLRQRSEMRLSFYEYTQSLKTSPPVR